MEMNANEEEKVQPSGFETLKKHLVKHKKKYIIGGIAVLAFGFGFHFGNRGNSRHQYSRLLKDGVKDAVGESIREVVDSSMRNIVKDGMGKVVTETIEDTITDTVDATMRDFVKDGIKSAVKSAIKDSAVTIIKEVKTVEQPLKNKHIDEIQKMMDYISEGDGGGLKIRLGENGTIYTIKNDI
jgi:hypothetical protein